MPGDILQELTTDAALFLILAAFLLLVTLSREANINIPPGVWGYMTWNLVSCVTDRVHGYNSDACTEKAAPAADMGNAPGLEILA